MVPLSYINVVLKTTSHIIHSAIILHVPVTDENLEGAQNHFLRIQILLQLELFSFS